MSFFSKISDYFGSRTEYAEAAIDRSYNGANSALEAANTIKDAACYAAPRVQYVPAEAYNLAKNTAFGVGAASTAGALAFGSATITPAGIAAISATSFIATHPKECFETVKGIGSVAYNTANAGYNFTLAAVDAAMSAFVATADVADYATDKVTEVVEFVDYVNNFDKTAKDTLESLYGSMDNHNEQGQDFSPLAGDYELIDCIDAAPAA